MRARTAASCGFGARCMTISPGVARRRHISYPVRCRPWRAARVSSISRSRRLVLVCWMRRRSPRGNGTPGDHWPVRRANANGCKPQMIQVLRVPVNEAMSPSRVALPRRYRDVRRRRRGSLFGTVNRLRRKLVVRPDQRAPGGGVAGETVRTVRLFAPHGTFGI